MCVGDFTDEILQLGWATLIDLGWAYKDNTIFYHLLIPRVFLVLAMYLQGRFQELQF